MVFILVNAAEKASPSMLVEPPPRPPPMPPSVKVIFCKYMVFLIQQFSNHCVGGHVHLMHGWCMNNLDFQSQMLRNPSRPYNMNFKRFMPNFLKPTIVNVIEERFSSVDDP